MVYMAPNPPERAYWTRRGVKPKPWLLPLETMIRAFASGPEVQAFVNRQRALLIQHSTVDGAAMLAAFQAIVPANRYQAFKDYVVAQAV